MASIPEDTVERAGGVMSPNALDRLRAAVAEADQDAETALREAIASQSDIGLAAAKMLKHAEDAHHYARGLSAALALVEGANQESCAEGPGRDGAALRGLLEG